MVQTQIEHQNPFYWKNPKNAVGNPGSLEPSRNHSEPAYKLKALKKDENIREPEDCVESIILQCLSFTARTLVGVAAWVAQLQHQGNKEGLKVA